MTRRPAGESDEQRNVRQSAEVAAYEKAESIVPGTALHRGDGAGGGPAGGISWDGQARMAAARQAAGAPLNDVDHDALRRHTRTVPDDMRAMDTRPPVDRPTVALQAAPADTSHAAAMRALPRSGSDRRRVLDLLIAAGEHGATDDEMEQALELSHQTVSARRNGLVADGWVIPSGRSRPTRSGAPAGVWIIAP